MNCWEFKKCRFGPDAAATCPVPRCSGANGIHFGRNGGRACWAIDGCQCSEAVEAAGDKLAGCQKCGFMVLVRTEEADSMLSVADIRSMAYGSSQQASSSRLQASP